MSGPGLAPPPHAPPASAQARLSTDVITAFAQLEQRIDALVRPLDATRRRTRPADGGWSIDEILEHLCLANDDYLTAMERTLIVSPPLEHGAWRATLGGRALVWAMESTRRSAAPAAIVPGIEPREAVLDAMLGSLRRAVALLHRAEGMEWRRLRLSSPYARWLRLNFGDAALVLARHAERHARQMERVAHAHNVDSSLAPSHASA